MTHARSRRPDPSSTLRFPASFPLAFLVLLVLPASAAGGPPPLLEADLPSGQTIGTTIVWTVTPPDVLPRSHRFRIWHLGRGLTVLHDFGEPQQLRWVPTEEGLYFVRVDSRDDASGEVRSTSQGYWVEAPSGAASVLPTEHPLVALYSGRLDPDDRRVHRRCAKRRRPCQLRVHFQAEGDSEVSSTPPRPVRPRTATSFYVAGMRAETKYALHHEVLDARGRHLAFGPMLTHQTGSVGLPFPATSERVERSDPAAATDPVLLLTPINGPALFPYATDLQGRLIWYDGNAAPAVLTRAVEGGTFLELVGRGNPNVLEILREIDLAGNVVRQTTLEEVNRQVVEMGEDLTTTFHHDARKLPDGRIAVIGAVNREFMDIQGEVGPVSLLGDNVLVLGRDLRLEWIWNSFEELDVTREAILRNTCVVGQGGCRGTRPGVVSKDWTHSNGLDYSPEDGNLILSVRNQDWVVKIDYADAHGSGDVVWRLGRFGDFTLESDDEFPWFSYAHDPNLLTGNRLVIYDNGNTRLDQQGPAGFESRGQVYELDETSMTARIVTEAGLERNSFALGSAQELRGRDGYHFGTGLFPVNGLGSTAEEVGEDGALEYSLFTAAFVYRSYRLVDLYTPPPSLSESKDTAAHLLPRWPWLKRWLSPWLRARVGRRLGR